MIARYGACDTDFAALSSASARTARMFLWVLTAQHLRGMSAAHTRHSGIMAKSRDETMHAERTKQAQRGSNQSQRRDDVSTRDLVFIHGFLDKPSIRQDVINRLECPERTPIPVSLHHTGMGEREGARRGATLDAYRDQAGASVDPLDNSSDRPDVIVGRSRGYAGGGAARCGPSTPHSGTCVDQPHTVARVGAVGNGDVRVRHACAGSRACG